MGIWGDFLVKTGSGGKFVNLISNQFLDISSYCNILILKIFLNKIVKLPTTTSFHQEITRFAHAWSQCGVVLSVGHEGAVNFWVFSKEWEVVRASGLKNSCQLPTYTLFL